MPAASTGSASPAPLDLHHARVVFDIGANVGDWARHAIQINPQAVLHCFEPSLPTFTRLSASGLPDSVIRNNFGLSSGAGPADLLVFKDGAGINSLYRRTGLESYGLEPQQATESVRLDTLDHYCEAHAVNQIDFCKVDVEGHELEVFKGMSGMLARGRIRLLQFEYGGCNIDSRVLLKDIFDLFRPLDYAFYKVFPKSLRRVVRYDQKLENFQYQNWALVGPAGEPLVSDLI